MHRNWKGINEIELSVYVQTARTCCTTSSMSRHQVLLKIPRVLPMKIKTTNVSLRQVITGGSHGVRMNTVLSANQVCMLYIIHIFFHRAAWNADLQTRSSDENSACLSVRPSNAWIVTKRKRNLPERRFRARFHRRQLTLTVGFLRTLTSS